MSDLFTTTPAAPLAERVRPTTLAQVIGQTHLLGPGKPLRRAFDSRKLHSFILWGPPGVGKTTLARLTAQAFDCDFIAISAVLAGVKDIREAVVRAQATLDRKGKATVLFIDEIHRFSKAQQDALLPYVESGLFKIIGATTANPSMEVVSALLSRAQVYQLKSLTNSELRQVFESAKGELADLVFDSRAVEYLAEAADGDARRFLNLLEQVSSAAEDAAIKEVTPEFVKECTVAGVRRFDKGEDAAYEQISAFQKSIRGSQPDAALYWLARMLDGGADARYIARRLIVIASEDVGNADPRALQLALNAAEAYERLGSPEGDRALAQATTFLAAAPKSNAVYVAWNEAQAFVAAGKSEPVPMHLRNAPTRLMKEMGFNKGYRYAHDEPDAYAAGETYFPDDVGEQTFYRPVARGLEIKIGEKLKYQRALDEAAHADGQGRRRPAKD